MNMGCSSFSWETKDNKHFLGRTYDQFGALERNRITIIPAGSVIYLENDTRSLNRHQTAYASVGMGIPGLSTPILVDGINEKGLLGCLLYYPGFAHYEALKREECISVNPGFLISYLLGSCQTVREVCQRLTQVRLTKEPVFGKEIPVHYIFTDRSGETVIVEPDSGGLNIHRDSIGVLTNSPDYKWQIQNLRNYVGIQNEKPRPQKIGNYELHEFGEGIGGLGLPGDYSPVSRFVKLAWMKQFAPQANGELDAVTKMFHNFAVVTIPEGMIKSAEENDYEQTLCISVMCSESLTYYFALSNNRRIHAIHLDHALDTKQIRYINLPESQDIAHLN